MSVGLQGNASRNEDSFRFRRGLDAATDKAHRMVETIIADNRFVDDEQLDS